MNLRAFDLRADLDVMVELIQAAFHYPDNEGWDLNPDELTGIVDGFRFIRTLHPFFQIAGLFNPAFKNIMRGYIWEESGQAVGLVNVAPVGLANQTWVIGNVAVLPEHRRKGIARKLIQATLDLAGQHPVSNVILEVIAHNAPAAKLYTSMGFETYSHIVQLNRDAALATPPLLDLPAGYRIEPYHQRDWEARYTLMQTITPPNVQHYEPVSQQQFHKSLPMRLFRSVMLTLAPVKNTSYVVRQQSDNSVVACFSCYQRRQAGGINEINIDLDPQHAALAPYLLNFCVHTTAGRDIELRIPQWQTSVLQAALAAGFVNRAEWYLMGMHLTPSHHLAKYPE